MTLDAQLTCRDPRVMLAFLGESPDDRLLRQFHCRCCRRIWDLIIDERGRQAVNAAERFAAGKITMKELRDYRPFVRAAVCHAKQKEWIAEAEANFELTAEYCAIAANLFALCAAEATTSDSAATAHGGWEYYQEPDMIDPPRYLDPPRGSHYWAAASVGQARMAEVLAGSRHDESLP